MQCIARKIVMALCLLTLTFSAFSQSQWIGIYEFTEDGGKTAGGTGIVISHEIQIMTSDKGLVATLKSNGYQTAVDILCLVKAKGNKASLMFEGYGDDNMFERYTKGQLMLTLEEKADGPRSNLLTHWAAFKPSVAKNERSGKTYFVRSTNTKL